MGVKTEVIGKKYGRLTILNEYPKRVNGRSLLFLEAKCDCGNIKEIRKEKVLRGHTKSCGCIQSEMRNTFGERRRKGRGESAFNNCYLAYTISAKRRGYAFELSKEQFREIITQPCVYCGESLTQERKTPAESTGTFKYTGIDRYDNTKGYVFENCVPCCRRCNRIKETMDVEEMEIALEKILSRKDIWLHLKESHNDY